jgi:hypothetical protein
MTFQAPPVRYAVLLKANATAADIEALAAKSEPGIAKAVLAALQAQADSIDLDALAEALKAGNVAAVEAMITSAMFEGKLDAVAAPLQDAAWASGLAVVPLVHRAARGVTFQFDRVSPYLVNWLSTYKLNLIRQVNNTTREAIRGALVTGMRAGQNPKKTAVAIKQIVGLTSRQSQAVANFRKELETFHARKSAAGWNLGAKIDRVNGTQVFRPDEGGDPKDGIVERRLRDFRYDKALDTAMKSGKPLKPEQIDKMVEAYAKKYRAYRARNIARTEAMRTCNAGVQEGWRQGIAGGHVVESLIRRKWILTKDERLCSVCSPIPGMNPKLGVPFGSPFKTPKGPVFLPGVHPSCRCGVWIQAYEQIQIDNQKDV